MTVTQNVTRATYTITTGTGSASYEVSFGARGPAGPAGASDWDDISNKPSVFPTNTANISDVTSDGATYPQAVLKTDSLGDVTVRNINLLDVVETGFQATIGPTTNTLTASRGYGCPNASGTLALTARADGVPDALAMPDGGTISGGTTNTARIQLIQGFGQYSGVRFFVYNASGPWWTLWMSAGGETYFCNKNYGYVGWVDQSDAAAGTVDVALYRNAAGVVEINNGTAGQYRDLKLRQIIPDRTDAGTTGAQTINKAAGSVILAAAGTSLVVTNSLVTTSSRVLVTVNSNDTTCKSAAAVSASGSFTIYPDAAPTADTTVSFLVLNP